MKTKNINNCARCGKDHIDIYFETFTNPPTINKYTHWAMCPTLSEPILMWIEEEE